MFKFASAARNGHSLFFLAFHNKTLSQAKRDRPCETLGYRACCTWNLGAIYLRLSTLRQVLDQPHLKRLVRDAACPGKGLWDVGKGTGALGHHGLSKPSFLAL